MYLIEVNILIKISTFASDHIGACTVNGFREETVDLVSVICLRYIQNRNDEDSPCTETCGLQTPLYPELFSEILSEGNLFSKKHCSFEVS